MALVVCGLAACSNQTAVSNLSSPIQTPGTPVPHITPEFKVTAQPVTAIPEKRMLILTTYAYRMERAERLLQMIEWHARAVRGAQDTWHNGRFLERWADPRAVAGLGGAMAHYDAGDVRRALQECLQLFSWLAIETGEAIGCAYPREAEERIRELSEQILAPAEG